MPGGHLIPADDATAFVNGVEQAKLLSQREVDADAGSVGRNQSPDGHSSLLLVHRWWRRLAIVAGLGVVAVFASLRWAPSAWHSIRDLPGEPVWPSSNGEDRRGSMQLVGTAMDTDDPQLMTFYMYRAQSSRDYPLENVNAGDLPGVMYYLHNEIMGADPRKYNVSRIMRYKVTMKPTQEMFDERGTQFGPFVAFDNGHCTSPKCEDIWDQFGFNIGCQVLDPVLSSYRSPFQTKRDCKPLDDCPGVWFSMPGQCPSKNLIEKTQECAESEMGGACASVTGEKICTYHYEHAGEVQLDTLSGFDDNTQWWRHGRAEYVKSLDKGIGTDFWDGRMDVNKSIERINKVQELFQDKYPTLPVTYGQPPCDFSRSEP